VEKQVHKRWPELEIWAVTVLGRVGAPGDARRLRVLSGNTTVTQTIHGEVIAAYAAAVRALEAKGN